MLSIAIRSGSGDVRSLYGTDEPVYVEAKYVILKRVLTFRINVSERK
jgi:hypothetical protein